MTEKSLRAPSDWLEDVLSFSGQFGQVKDLFSCSGGIGIISSCVTDSAPCLMDVPIQSEPVSPPPITTTFLLVASISLVVVGTPSLETLLFCCGKNSIAKWTPSKSLPSTGKSLGCSEPPERTIASYSSSKSSIEISTPILIPYLKIVPSPSSWLMRLSITCFSILKSGIPYLNNPPALLFFSKTVTSWPALVSCWAQASPAGPAPIIATFFSVLFFIICGLIQPSSKPLSIIAHSIVLIETGSSYKLSVHAASHGAGHILPVNSGKLLVECKFSRAFFQSFE